MQTNDIGYSDHGKGALSPPEPQFECVECGTDCWEHDDLNDNGVCEACESDFCNECGRHMDGTGFCENCRYMA